MKDYIFIIATIGFTVYGQIVIKWRMTNVNLPVSWLEKLKVLFILVFDPFIFTGFCSAFLSAVFWMAAMTKFEVSFAYPIVISGLIILTTLFSCTFLGESYSVIKVFALTLILIGVGLMAMES